jgi:hypothetical protein
MESIIPYFLFTLYVIVFMWLLYRSGLQEKTSISNRFWCWFFLLKVGFACFYGWWYAQIPVDKSDTWWFFSEALKQKKTLTADPIQFLLYPFQSFNLQENGYLDHAGFWNDLKSYALIQLIALLQFLSADNYYVTTVLFSAIGFWSAYWLIRTYHHFVKRQIHWLEAVVLACLPSTLFWTSGIHRDALLFLCLTALLWQLVQHYQSPQRKRWLFAGLLLLPMALFRNYWLFLLVPPTLIWLSFAPRLKAKLPLALACTALTMLALLILSPTLQHGIVESRTELLHLQGQSKLIPLHTEASPGSFITNLIPAWTLFYYVPMTVPVTSPMVLLPYLEQICLLLSLLIIAIQYRKHRLDKPTADFLFLLLMVVVFAGLLLGWTIPYAGAMVRYRAPFITLMILMGLLSRRHI